MLGRIIGAMVGNAIDRSDGRGGLKGAAIGALAPSVIRALGPVGLAVGGFYLAKKALDRRRTRI